MTYSSKTARADLVRQVVRGVLKTPPEAVEKELRAFADKAAAVFTEAHLEDGHDRDHAELYALQDVVALMTDIDAELAVHDAAEGRA